MVSENILMPVMAVLFIVFNTVINKWLDGHVETAQNILAILILVVALVNGFTKTKSEKLQWFDYNKLVLIYFAIRIITTIRTGFDYSVIRSVFFELFYFFGISKIWIQKNRKFYITIFIALEFIFTSMSLILFYSKDIINISQTLKHYTYFEEWGNALIFSNPNTAGIFSGFAIVLALILYKTELYNKKLITIFGIYNIVPLFLFGCRSAELGILVVLITLLLCKACKFKKNKIAVWVLIISIASLVPIYTVSIYKFQTEGFLSYDNLEAKVDEIGSSRYVIWKECIYTQKDHFLLGEGSLKREQEARRTLMLSDDVQKKWKNDFPIDNYFRYYYALAVGPHNGYIGTISSTGLLGFILFIAILLQRIKRAEFLNKGNWYLILVFCFVINCFECLFIQSRFFTCFYMFLILAVDMNEPAEIESEHNS